MNQITELAAKITAAYVEGNKVPSGEVPGLLRTIQTSLVGLGSGPLKPQIVKPSEAEVRASIRAEGIRSFEDGKVYKALRRHLTIRGLSPTEYRRKWGLPVDYPMVCADYSVRRSEISRQIGAAQRTAEAAAA